MTLLEQPPAPELGRPPGEVVAPVHRGARAVPWLVALALAAGVLSRVTTRSALWLDEALSVHIARLPLDQIPGALRRDGAPPLYYVLLHGWIRLFGESAGAVRSLSCLFGVAALPVLWLLARRLRDTTTAWLAVLLLASSPFAVHYATEARMYSLLVLEVLLGGLALQRAAQRPSAARLVPVAVLAGLLVLTHYWSLFLLVLLFGQLAWRARHTRAARRLMVAEAAGSLLVLPWLPTLLFQVQHTGTPWAPTPSLTSALDSVGAWAGGGATSAQLLTLLLLALPVVAVLGHAQAGTLVLGRPVSVLARDLAVLSFGSLLLGLGVDQLIHAGYAARYSSVALGPALLLAAIGLRALPQRALLVLTGAAVALGLFVSVQTPLDYKRTQAAAVAALLRASLQPGDVVLSCPDQLGPAVQDLLPPGTDQVVYPTLAGPDRIDWVDYAQRNAAAVPEKVVQQVLDRARGHSIWLLDSSGYRTFGTQCMQVAEALAASHVITQHVLHSNRHYLEHEDVYHYSGLLPPVDGPRPTVS